MLATYRNLPRLEGRSQSPTWLPRIVLNAALMRLRSRRPRPALSMDEPLGETEMTLAEQPADPAPGPKELLARQELNDLLQQNLTALSPDMQAVVRLRGLEGFSTR